MGDTDVDEETAKNWWRHRTPGIAAMDMKRTVGLETGAIGNWGPVWGKSKIVYG